MQAVIAEVAVLCLDYFLRVRSPPQMVTPYRVHSPCGKQARTAAQGQARERLLEESIQPLHTRAACQRPQRSCCPRRHRRARLRAVL